MSHILLRSQRFLPLFVTQFLGAFNDNLFKNAFVSLIAFRLAVQAGESGQMHIILSGAIFILPYLLFSATAGQLADKYDKSTLARLTKLWEIAIMVTASIAFFTTNLWFLQIVLFCLGIQAAFFGPIKYALLPQHLHENELISGNAYIEAGTFLAILLGTIIGELLGADAKWDTALCVSMVLCATGGYLSSLRIPPAPPQVPDLVIGKNIWRETWHIVAISKKQPVIYLSIMGSSWFWFVGATLLSQLPTYTHDVIGGDQTVFALLLTMFSLGIGLGSLLCNTLLAGQIKATFVSPAAFFLSIFTLDLYFASLNAPHHSGATLLTAARFLGFIADWRILFDLLMISVSAGLYIVPLCTIMQEFSPVDERARVIAANNIINAVFMVGSAIAALVLVKLSFTIPQIFLTVALSNVYVAWYIRRLVPMVETSTPPH